MQELQELLRKRGRWVYTTVTQDARMEILVQPAPVGAANPRGKYVVAVSSYEVTDLLLAWSGAVRIVNSLILRDGEELCYGMRSKTCQHLAGART